MAGHVTTEKKSTRPICILGILISGVMNLVVMSILAWFFLIIVFGFYCLTQGKSTAYRLIPDMVQANTVAIENTGLLGNESFQGMEKVKTWFSQVIILIQQKISAIEAQWPLVKQGFVPVNHWLITEVVPLVLGVSLLILTKDCIVLSALPLFLLCVGIGLIDGLVQRDIRKFQGARESAFLFHSFKRSSSFWFFMPLFIYLLLPWPIAPQWLLIPTAIGLGVLTQLSTRSFKKYL